MLYKKIYLKVPWFLFVGIGFCFSLESRGAEKIHALFLNARFEIQGATEDTLWVLQNDTSFFNKISEFVTRPCSKPEFVVWYELKAPKDGAYYLIYNAEKKLIQEGKYTSEYTYDDYISTQGGFYNLKRYYYKKNGNVTSMHYMEDGRNIKTEYVDRKKRVTKIRYIDKKSEETTKIEIYRRGQLKKTHMYTGFNNYYTLKPIKGGD